jgi:hypothetical protein
MRIPGGKHRRPSTQTTCRAATRNIKRAKDYAARHALSEGQE